ncbi:MAG TPA: MspI family type II restriction endonuclease [Saccharofermentans sp.]|nr:MspI family type II restriction endonuclease [Saccharofermentans sp.]
MNEDNSRKAQIGAFSNASLSDQLQYLRDKNIISEFHSQKFGYTNEKKDQFKCDYIITLENGEKWILFSANSLTSDRLKTKQWDSYHIKVLNKEVKHSYIVCPDTIQSQPKAYHDFLRYRQYIEKGQITSSIDNLLLQSEFISLIEQLHLGDQYTGKKAAMIGNNFESLLIQILTNSQNLLRWKGNELAVGWQYELFEKIIKKLDFNPQVIKDFTATTNIKSLPKFQYTDGSYKCGGRPKTDLLLTVNYDDGSSEEFTFSCKSTSKKDIAVQQFPNKYLMELFNIQPADTLQLLDEYLASGGPRNMDTEKSKLLTARLKPYAYSIAKWALGGQANDGSDRTQQAEFLITRYQHNGIEDIEIETIDECISRSEKNGKGNFGTIFGWTVTSKDNNGINFPQLRIYVK